LTRLLFNLQFSRRFNDTKEDIKSPSTPNTPARVY
jgi:hypothetical protein